MHALLGASDGGSWSWCLALASLAVRLADQFVPISDFDGFRGRCTRCHLPMSYFFWYVVSCEQRHSELTILSGTDCGLRLHDAMYGTSNAIGHLERAGDTNLPDVDDQTGIVKHGWNE